MKTSSQSSGYLRRLLVGASLILFSGHGLLAQERSGESSQVLAFAATDLGEVREGYLTLQWNDVTGAERYEVFDSQGRVAYSGSLPKAFLSGLSDGTYRYSVRAVSESDAIIAVSKESAVVNVSHWPMRYVVVLFSVGLIVVVTVAIVIVRGAGEDVFAEAAD